MTVYSTTISESVAATDHVDILFVHPVRGNASASVSQAARAQLTFSEPVSAFSFDAPTVKSSVSVGRQNFKQVR